MALIDVFKHALPIKLKDGKRHVFPTVASLVYRKNDQPLEDENGVLIADDANKLGGKLPEAYATKEDLENIDIPTGGTANVAYNALDNSYFKKIVNQRGVSGTINAAGYFIDRWKLVSGSVTVDADGLTLDGEIAQIIETTPDGNVTAAASAGNASFDAESNTFSLTASGELIEWAALYEGEYTAKTLPPYVPKGYAAELLECKRYYRRFKGAYIPAALHITSIKRYVISFILDVPFIKTGTKPSVNLIKAPGTLRAGGKTYDLADVMVYEVKEYDGSLYIIFQTSTSIPDAYAAFVGESEYEISKDL